ncbi:AraC-type DNA-binding protein [Collimonas sp. OK307]|uniref:helix-turn-helix transcriptional regulator n=1 Tax=Collimonas sp. OK307 TaxID=1801620 RepID=UPI0008F00D77|nr:helix-turn-helix domain-containing protein [Collimonas sp. OK307]SFI32699.1 AraC-type DNA-binding protein [Collimonas sp. OK307]
MSHHTISTIQHWSTEEVTETERVDYFADVLSSSLCPMRVASRAKGPFRAEMLSSELGLITVIRQGGSAHQSHRGKKEIALSTERSYHLLIALTSEVALTHCGFTFLKPGSAVITDSNFPHDLEFFSPWRMIHLKLPEQWLRQWIPDPAALTGRLITSDFRWATPLLAFATQLSPEFVVHAPLPQSVLLDHLGALLSLIAADISGTVSSLVSSVNLALKARIWDRIKQRCAETTLTGAQIASELDIPIAVLHATLGASSQTFGSLLIEARVTQASWMLKSPVFKSLTTTAVGHRVGFTNLRHFARAFKRLIGRTPSQFRLDR